MISFLLISLVIKEKEEIINENITEMIHVRAKACFVSRCSFIDTYSKTDGGAILYQNRYGPARIEECNFENCTARTRGGAMLIQSSLNYFKGNCYFLCRGGPENGNDGAALFADSNNKSIDLLNTYSQCPQHGKKCWYGICIFWNGNMTSKDINVSDSHTQFGTGLMHAQCFLSIVKRYRVFNITEGNALSFMNGADGPCDYGAIIDSSTKTGLIYLQAASHNISHFVFRGSKGALTYGIIVGKAYFFDCVFDRKENSDNGWVYGGATRCVFDKLDIMLSMFPSQTKMFKCVGFQGKSIISPTIAGIIISLAVVLVILYFANTIRCNKVEKTLSLSSPYVLQAVDLESPYKKPRWLF